MQLLQSRALPLGYPAAVGTSNIVDFALGASTLRLCHGVPLFITSASTPLSSAMLSLEKLIQNKRVSGRPKDLDGLAFLEKWLVD